MKISVETFYGWLKRHRNSHSYVYFVSVSSHQMWKARELFLWYQDTCFPGAWGLCSFFLTHLHWGRLPVAPAPCAIPLFHKHSHCLGDTPLYGFCFWHFQLLLLSWHSDGHTGWLSLWLKGIWVSLCCLSGLNGACNCLVTAFPFCCSNNFDT